MRIKLTTSSPLPNYNCWFVLTEKNEAQTVHHLRRKIVKDLELNSEPSLLQLSMDGFHLLPQSNIQGLLRDGDLINVEQVNFVKPIIKKRKLSSVEESPPPPVKKSKKEKSTKASKPESKEKKESKSEEKKRLKALEKECLKAQKIKSSKAAEKKRSRSEEKVIKSKKTPKQVAKENKVAEKIVQKSTPFEGKEQTKKRNMRRRELKRRLRTVAAVDPIPVQINTAPALVDQEVQIQNLSISNVEPSQLLKKNKNKKKNHMKQMDQRSHVHYPQDKEVAAPEQVTTVVGNNGNQFGRAFVTFVESEKNYKERHNSNFSQEYPIHRMPTLFYANKGLTENELSQPETELVVDQAQPAELHQVETVTEVAVVQPPVNHVQEEKKEINYNDLVQVNFSDNVPSVGSKLAIKTLELTSTYTPEISDWKHVILKQIDTENGQVKFEFLPGYGKATTKGGKFDNKKNRKRYDDWYDQQQQHDDDDEEEEEEEEENEATFEMTDIFEMRIIS
ncbi:hypothetical protein EDC94DRAFT_690666 [Helicostylum pulchrum]|uniref:Coilin n=1 Tax=Helicostylum pulchrum TaxID=562976 RepID=A0ABP9XLQ2_9FUNG|nr:hypothetical protein EDC94DRAFT_690666 [Helicostylum pulchrum]